VIYLFFFLISEGSETH